MRALTIASGIAVLLTALHFTHAIQHFYTLSPNRDAGTWAGIAFAILVDLLAIFGGFRLLKPGR
ncbi:MAG TPA: hypothetical protein VH308_05885 [Terracidiphilus sp.]|jgi:hypothetical protein|nr:hypothetical protein [Terracidiphilus sp.]